MYDLSSWATISFKILLEYYLGSSWAQIGPFFGNTRHYLAQLGGRLGDYFGLLWHYLVIAWALLVLRHYV